MTVPATQIPDPEVYLVPELPWWVWALVILAAFVAVIVSQRYGEDDDLDDMNTIDRHPFLDDPADNWEEYDDQ